MLLPIVKYGDPVLRRKGAPVGELTPEILRLIDDMLETMKDAAGVGLAAQQVGHALQLAVVDVREVQDRPSVMELAGKPVEPADHMPLVLVNPTLRLLGDYELGPEGCLSFPEIYSDIPRPEAVEVRATNQRGEPLEFRAGGLLSRAIQHEYDHLQGILFIDRMDTDTRRKLRTELEAMQAATRATLVG
jgi:peptide deformylase